jgi:hypothetical protein
MREDEDEDLHTKWQDLPSPSSQHIQKWTVVSQRAECAMHPDDASA